MELVYLILGLTGLWLGSELVIRGALNISKHYKISHIFLGLVVLAIGTDLPELVVTITGSIYQLKGTDTSGLIIGNAIGSCFGQIGFVLGIIALLGIITLAKKDVYRDGIMMVVSVVLLSFAAYDGQITKAEGLTLIAVYLLYLFVIYREESLYEKMKKAPSMHVLKNGFFVVAGFLVIYFASDAVVKNGLILANSWGISQTIIGITLIGLGTSLPELFVSLNAFMKGNTRLSAANLIGSNIFDAIVIPGIGAAIAGLNVDKGLLLFDIPLLLFLSAAIIYLFHRNKRIHRKEAVFILIVYVGYICMKVFGKV